MQIRFCVYYSYSYEYNWAMPQSQTADQPTAPRGRDTDNRQPQHYNKANICKQFESRLGLTKGRSRSGSKLFGTLIVLLKEFFKKVHFEKNQQTTKKHEKLPTMQKVCGRSAIQIMCSVEI